MLALLAAVRTPAEEAKAEFTIMPRPLSCSHLWIQALNGTHLVNSWGTLSCEQCQRQCVRGLCAKLQTVSLRWLIVRVLPSTVGARVRNPACVFARSDGKTSVGGTCQTKADAQLLLTRSARTTILSNQRSMFP